MFLVCPIRAIVRHETLANDMLGQEVDFIDSLSIGVVSGPWRE
jgi:hypothetical protein